MEPPRESGRIQRRVEAAIAIRVQGLDSSGHAYDDATTAVEVSRRGLSFLTRHSLAVLAALTIVIPGLGPMRTGEGFTDFFTEAIIVRITKEDDGFYRVGVRFVGATLPMYSAERL
jgi:hypothetical protein